MVRLQSVRPLCIRVKAQRGRRGYPHPPVASITPNITVARDCCGKGDPDRGTPVWEQALFVCYSSENTCGTSMRNNVDYRRRWYTLACTTPCFLCKFYLETLLPIYTSFSVWRVRRCILQIIRSEDELNAVLFQPSVMFLVLGVMLLNERPKFIRMVLLSKVCEFVDDDVFGNFRWGHQ